MVPIGTSTIFKIFDTQDLTNWFRLCVDLEPDRLVLSLGLLEDRRGGRHFRLLTKTEIRLAVVPSSVLPFITDALSWAEDKLKSPMEMLVDDLKIGFIRRYRPRSVTPHR